MNRFDPSVIYAIRNLGWGLATRNLAPEILRDADYEILFRVMPAEIEHALVVWANNALLEDDGDLINEQEALLRTAEYIRSRTDPSYHVDNPFQDWELEYD